MEICTLFASYGLLATLHEISGIISLCICTFFLLYSIVKKSKISHAVSLFGITTIGFAILVLSPGNHIRYMQGAGHKLELESIFLIGPKNYFVTFFTGIKLYQILLALLVGILIGVIFEGKYDRIRFKNIILISVTIFPILAMITFSSSVYGANYDSYVVIRTMTMASLGLYVSLILLGYAFISWAGRFDSKNKVFLILTTLILLFSVKGFSKFNIDYITGLTIRKEVMYQREKSIIYQAYQINSRHTNNKTINVEATPVPFKNSQAVDFTIGGYFDNGNLLWFARDFKAYYHIQNIKLQISIPSNSLGDNVLPQTNDYVVVKDANQYFRSPIYNLPDNFVIDPYFNYRG